MDWSAATTKTFGVEEIEVGSTNSSDFDYDWRRLMPVTTSGDEGRDNDYGDYSDYEGRDNDYGDYSDCEGRDNDYGDYSNYGERQCASGRRKFSATTRECLQDRGGRRISV